MHACIHTHIYIYIYVCTTDIVPIVPNEFPMNFVLSWVGWLLGCWSQEALSEENRALAEKTLAALPNLQVPIRVSIQKEDLNRNQIGFRQQKWWFHQERMKIYWDMI